MNYTSMIAVNQEENMKKMNIAKKMIKQCLDSGKRITVTVLAKQTGLSRGFFYKNEQIRADVDRAIEYQRDEQFLEKPMIDMKEDIIEEQRIMIAELKLQNRKLIERNEELYQSVKKLEKQLGHKRIEVVR